MSHDSFRTNERSMLRPNNYIILCIVCILLESEYRYIHSVAMISKNKHDKFEVFYQFIVYQLV